MEIVEPYGLTLRTANFNSIHNDGSSAAKIMDQEFFLMILASDDKAKFQVMSLEEPANIDANNGLKASLDKSLSKLKCSMQTL